ncbi:hypothetical protein J2Z69_001719 [Paenibacillus shirakamiensis]|uniref:Uncharacterized protein n=1 Tax=Paenibacillus shirakamiensis TaxID=1265935 RepID=A0ABS4JG51_9BACL|nr:hypothetical protein [Paenibacillus shirakamiensis]MBP2000688.1 hypothetical protein [Paenibacillus shirakamiensis]
MFEPRILNGVEEDLAKKRYAEIQNDKNKLRSTMLSQLMNTSIVVAIMAIIIAVVYMLRFR